MEINKYLKEVYENYNFVNSKFFKRYLPFKNLDEYLKSSLPEYIEKRIIGYSELNSPIYALDFGFGKTKVLMWSQMHGNETTTTKSIFDLISFTNLNQSNEFVNKILSLCHIRIIPMLNPDGATLYTRLNANGVDLNRDAVNRSQNETKAFFKNLEEFQPDYCFNLHGQRTIFGAGSAGSTATMSFLAPSLDKALTINETRKKAMYLINSANELLQNIIPHQVGRYDDTHNINCFGDFIQHKGIPTVLFEAGHFPNDYCRNETRKFVTLSLLKMLYMTCTKDEKEQTIEKYESIPMNHEIYCDLKIENVKNLNNTSIDIQYQEVLRDGNISFIPFVKSLDQTSLYAHQYINAHNSDVNINGSKKIDINTFIDKLEINNEIINLEVKNC
jgi:hypothetical protein